MSRENEVKGTIIGGIGGAALGAIKGGSIGVLLFGTGVGIPVAIAAGVAGLIIGNKVGSELDRK